MGNTFHNIVSIIVTNDCDKDIFKSIDIVLEQVNHIIIIDNKSNSESVKNLISIQRRNSKNVTLVLNAENYGLAKAQNQGIKLASKRKHKWILFLDQDSIMEFNMIEKFLSHHQKNKTIKFMGPKIVEQNIIKENKYFIQNKYHFLRRKTIKEIDNFNDIFVIISSGSLIHIDVFKKIGLFRDDFFIDYIDFEFSVRARLNDFQISLVKDAILYHKQGNHSSHNLLFMKIDCHNYNHLRRYTIARNRIYYIRTFFYNVPFLLLNEIGYISFDFLRVLFFEKNKVNKIFNILLGIFHGIIKKIPSYVDFQDIQNIDKGCDFEIISQTCKK